MPEHNPKLRHLLIHATAATEKYVPRSTGGRGAQFPQRNRRAHGKKLIGQLDQLTKEAKELGQKRIAFGLDAKEGICLTFESEPDFDLKLDSLEFLRSGIELLAVRKEGKKTLATVFVPEGKLRHFENLVKGYLKRESPSGKPKNQALVDSISEIRRAALEALWMDGRRDLPASNQQIWWEVWLRVGKDRLAQVQSFKDLAHRLGITIGADEINFPDRTILLARATKSQMSRSVDLLDTIAELRRAKETAEFFVDLNATEQADWIGDAINRLVSPTGNHPAVCLLDTGVNASHPLIKPACEDSDLHSYDPDWGRADNRGHGTGMAGLILYGDLVNTLSSSGPIDLRHRLESVKVLPPPEHPVNDPRLYGAITGESIARAEIAAPQRKRIVCMAVSTTDFRDQGRPSSWSACLDALCSGSNDGVQRLIVVAAGNTDTNARAEYPNSNITDAVHDPGQSWNAITVGAFTEKVSIDQSKYPGWQPIAPSGDLSPSSCTSIPWGKKSWPLKPDIVMEGGNMAIRPDDGSAADVPALQLLSTSKEVVTKPLNTMGETSAATALAARMAAMLQAEYPDFWPETIRGLLVHSSEWTPAMKKRFEPLGSREKIRQLIRYCGFGVPNLSNALWSALNQLTLIAQDSLQPFDKVGGDYKFRELNIHKVPWPKEILQELSEIQVNMKVTLSYFIEPNPAERGWTRRHRYASHALRFDVKTPEENLKDFRKRVNQAAWDEESAESSKSDAEKWKLGPDLRGLGSLHSDSWTGTAAQLAEREYIAVFPIIGWWRERYQLDRWNKRARYSLIVTIRTPAAEVDIYTPVMNQILPQVQIEI